MLAVFTISVTFAMVLALKVHEPAYKRRYKNNDEAFAMERKEIKRLPNISLAPELDEVVRNGALALLPRKRFVIVNLTSLRIFEGGFMR